MIHETDANRRSKFPGRPLRTGNSAPQCRRGKIFLGTRLHARRLAGPEGDPARGRPGSAKLRAGGFRFFRVQKRHAVASRTRDDGGAEGGDFHHARPPSDDEDSAIRGSRAKPPRNSRQKRRPSASLAGAPGRGPSKPGGHRGRKKKEVLGRLAEGFCGRPDPRLGARDKRTPRSTTTNEAPKRGGRVRRRSVQK